MKYKQSPNKININNKECLNNMKLSIMNEIGKL